MMNAHFAAAVPNLRIMEMDIDRLAWDDELVTRLPQIEAGHLIVPDRPGGAQNPTRTRSRRTRRSHMADGFQEEIVGYVNVIPRSAPTPTYSGPLKDK